MIFMANNYTALAGSTLDHLLEIEAAAAAIVDDAQIEAAKRIHENDEKNRIVFDERYKVEIQNHLSRLNDEIEKVKIQYKKELDDYRKEISGINVEKDAFCALFNKYISDESS